MGVIYSGETIIYQNTLPANGTALCDWIKGQLEAAGWTTVSGSSGNWVMDSLATPEGLQSRVKLKTNTGSWGAGYCLVEPRSVDDTLGAGENWGWLYADGNRTYYLWANPFQFFVWERSISADGFVFHSNPHVPAFMQSNITQAILAGGCGVRTQSLPEFRTYLAIYFSVSIVNGIVQSNKSYHVRMVGKMAYYDAGAARTGAPQFRYFDSNRNYMMSLPEIQAPISGNDWDVSTVGILWDAVQLHQSIGAWREDITYDGHTWLNLTYSCNPAYASLLLLKPAA